MARMKYSPSLVAKIVNWLPGHTDKELAKHLSELTGEPFDAQRAKNWRVVRKIPQGRRLTKEERYSSQRMDPELLEDIRRFTPGHNDHELAAYLSEKLGRSFDRRSAKGFRINHDIPLGAAIPGGGRFQKGQESWSKGKKLGHRSIETEFKVGHRPHNYKPIGSRTKAYIRDGHYYWKTKIADPDQWEFDHRLIWERERGPIPDDHVVIFLDRDPEHLNIDNLACISKTILQAMNKHPVNTNDPEIVSTAIEIAKLRSAVSKKRKEMKK